MPSADDGEQEDEAESQARLEWMRSAVAEAEAIPASEWTPGETARTQTLAYLSDLVARITPNHRYAEVSVGHEVGHEITDADLPSNADVSSSVSPKPVRKRVFDLFPHPGFKIPDDFDELPEDELKAWNGESE
jgi:hypothetical protein